MARCKAFYHLIDTFAALAHKSREMAASALLVAVAPDDDVLGEFLERVRKAHLDFSGALSAAVRDARSSAR
jgi:hypothetical protein